MTKYKVMMTWYSEVIVEAKNKEEAREKGKYHEDSSPDLEEVNVEIYRGE